jgi:chromosome segregation protein
VVVVSDADFGSITSFPAGGRIVTKSGDMKRWDGYVRRAHAVANSAAILEQRARLLEIQELLASAQSKSQTDAGASANARAFTDQCRTKAKAMRTEAPRAFAALGLAREKVAKLEAERARGQALLEQAQNNLAAMNLECEQAAALLKVTQELLASLPVHNDTTHFSNLETAVSQARLAASKAQSDLALAQGQLSARSNRRDAIKTDLLSWSKRKEQASSRLIALEVELQQANQLKAAAKQAPEHIESRGRDILAQTPIAQARKSAADDAIANLEASIRGARERARQAQNTLADCREARALAVTRLEAETTRLDELMDDVRRNLQVSPEDCETKARDVLGDSYETLNISNGESRLAKLLYDRDALGGVNLRAEEEVIEQETRLEALIADKDDLNAAVVKLRGGVDQINAEGKVRLQAAFEEVHKHFKVLFAALFDGGVAELQLTDSDDPLGGGLEVYACPPGKKLQSLTLMSGGEQALTASALIFAVFLSNPSPICVLDEVDAPLDDSNVDRYCRLLNEMRDRTQTRFIVITHHPITMARMDRLFGITMAERGVSQVVSVDLTRAEALIASA